VSGPGTYNFADIFESVAARVPERTALVCGAERRSFAELDSRADLLAGWMERSGVRRDGFVGIALRNGPEYVETTLAAHKLRAVPVNVNYRLRVEELRYLLHDGPLVGVVHEPELGEPLAEAGAGGSAWLLARGAGYASALASGPPAPRRPRSGDDLYVLYTGGTTGRPKGVVWRMADALFACIGGGDPRGDRGPVTAPEQLPDRIGEPITFLPAAPLVHAAGMWTTLRWLFAGSSVVLAPGFDPVAIWVAVAEQRVSVMNIVGDAMARPLLDTAPPSTPLRVLGSGGATLSPELKAALLGRFPDLTIKDTFGSSETGVQGWSVHAPGDPTAARFRTVDSVVLDPDTMRPLPAGATRPGVIARAGHVPMRYHGDPEASARTFREIDGVRHALTGDLGRIEADGTVTVLGRGSQCINTGGEKVFAEEVESVLRAHPDVLDAVVVGLPDPRWGQAVTAVVSARPGFAGGDDLREHCRRRLAGFKVPKRVVRVDEVRRGPAGKPDYTWASARARDDLQAGVRP